MRFIGVFAWLALVSVLSAATLSNARRVGTDFEFSIVGVSNAAYAIEASLDLQNWTRVATNSELGELRIISLPASGREEFYRVRRFLPLFRRALAAQQWIEFAGIGVHVDSFDSADPLASTDGQYDPAKARDHGDIVTASALTNSLLINSAKVAGVLHVPRGGSVVLSGGGSVGSSAWINSGQFGIEPGHLVEGTTGVYAHKQLPKGSIYITPGPGSVNGTNFTYVLSNGRYTLPELVLSSTRTMVITGRATLYVTGSVDVRGGIVILREASLALYVGGTSADINFSGVVNESRNAAAFAYYGLPGNINVSVTGSNLFTATIHAPSAGISFGGGGNELEMSGAVIGRYIRVNGKMRMHYDERLGVAAPEL